MGRRAYLNRLALGRSPYEAPEIPAGSSGDQASSAQRITSPLHADGYVQHYDERGHPVNPESKTFGRELRRAKNDILSTMGIVVSEDTSRGRNQQEKIDAIVTENDLGLAMVTLDQFSVFLGSWWTTSLTGRIQTFKSFAHVPLTRIINYESVSFGILGFYFAGIPAWAMSACLSICRHHPLERLISLVQNYFPNNDAASKLVRASFTILHTAARGSLLALAMQTYMYSSLQSLHLIPPTSIPSIANFMPFGKFASMLLPSLPSDISFTSLISFALSVLKTPSLLYIYVYLRPFIEVRLYRLIRRRLPKPDLTDQLSVKVAFDNDLVDWMVPVLGRRGDEEAERSNLSLIDDLLYELRVFRQLLSSKFTFKSRQSSLVLRGENKHQCEVHQTQGRSAGHPSPGQEQQHQRRQEAQPDTTDRRTSIRGYDENSARADSEVSNEENQLPDADNMNLLRRARNLTISTRTSTPDPDAHQDEGAAPRESQRDSRSHAHRSRTPSPTSSPPSPRVRAQVIQDSDVVAMQLELQSHQARRRSTTTENVVDPQNAEEGSVTRRSTSDLLDTLLSNEGQHITTMLSPEAAESNDLSNMTLATSLHLGGTTTASSSRNQPNSITEGLDQNDLAAEPTVSVPVNILPDVVEEPPLEDTTNQPSSSQPHEDSDDSDFYPNVEDADADADTSILPHEPNPTTPQNPPEEAEPVQASSRALGHRVTVLSSLPVDSLASHLASMITTALFAPLESLYLRSLASSYLASRSASALLRADVYPLGAWGGGRSWNDKVAYMGKLALMMGLQATVNASVWGIISGAAIRIGRRFCGWGAL
ncbi:uncharacterized protein BDV17DRAFT_267599 [Aspergillus undulatus]|uniref:uncharacterized protein n=1 Tax=Aspergillus undulatus TaxID=1810928 RepID=UPI003CCCAC48